MGFFDDLADGKYRSAGEKINSAVSKRAGEIAKTQFSNASDSQLERWWDEHEYDYDIADVVKEAAQREMRRRGLL